MTHILIIDPRREMIVHNIPVYENSDARHINSFFECKKAEYGDLERILLAGGTVRIMEPGDPVPVPLRAAARLVA